MVLKIGQKCRISFIKARALNRLTHFYLISNNLIIENSLLLIHGMSQNKYRRFLST